MIRSAHCTTTIDTKKAVAGVLQDLPVSVGPLLSIGVGQIIHCNGIPGPAEPEKMAWPKAVLTKDDKIDKEASRGLDHTDLAISHGDQAFVDELVSEGVPWRPLHDVRFSLFIGHGDGGHHVGTQVDAEDGDGTKGKWHVS